MDRRRDLALTDQKQREKEGLTDEAPPKRAKGCGSPCQQAQPSCHRAPLVVCVEGGLTFIVTALANSWDFRVVLLKAWIFCLR
eukprot:831278-Pelagomonas_calceolata.AAC.1